MTDSDRTQLLDLNQRLLDAIARRDWAVYEELTDARMTCFEPESRGQLVVGREFHRYYFEIEQTASPGSDTIGDPRVLPIGDSGAVVTYTRLARKLDPRGNPRTTRFEETRVWRREERTWRLVHFHRSSSG